MRSKRELLSADIGLGAADIEMMAVLPAGYFGRPGEIVALEPKLKVEGEDNRGGKVVPFLDKTNVPIVLPPPSSQSPPDAPASS